MGGCQNYGPFLGTLNISCRIIVGIRNGTTILTTTHIGNYYRVIKGDTRSLDYGTYAWSPSGLRALTVRFLNLRT